MAAKGAWVMAVLAAAALVWLLLFASSDADSPSDRTPHPWHHEYLAIRNVNNLAPPEGELSEIPGYKSGDPSFCGNIAKGSVGVRSKPLNMPVCTHGKGDIVSDSWLTRGHWQECLIMPWLAYVAYVHSTHYTEDGQPLVADVGGNIGSCSHFFLGLGVCPVTIEPALKNSLLLRGTWAINGWDCGTLVKAAIGEKSGTAKIKLLAGNLGGSYMSDGSKPNSAYVSALQNATAGEETVPVARVDSIIKHHLHFMKIDVQGYEILVLRSLDRLIRQFGLIDVIHVELSAKILQGSGVKPEEFFDLLFGWGYRLVLNGAEFRKSASAALIKEQLESEYKEHNFYAVSPRVFGRARMHDRKFWSNIEAASAGVWPNTLEAWHRAVKRL